jgi:hypothetical protein
VEQQGHLADGDAVQWQQQQQVAPWESEEHRQAVDNGTPLQVRVGQGSARACTQPCNFVCVLPEGCVFVC